VSESVLVAAVTGVLALAGTTTTALLSQRAHRPDPARPEALRPDPARPDPGDVADLLRLLEDERRAHHADRTRYWHAVQHIRSLLAWIASDPGAPTGAPTAPPAPPPDVAGDL